MVEKYIKNGKVAVLVSSETYAGGVGVQKLVSTLKI
jgi:hypothetical protein